MLMASIVIVLGIEVVTGDQLSPPSLVLRISPPSPTINPFEASRKLIPLRLFGTPTTTLLQLPDKVVVVVVVVVEVVVEVVPGC